MKRIQIADTLLSVVRKFHAEDAAGLMHDDAVELADIGIELAHQYGLRGDYSSGILAYLTWQFGMNFQEIIPPMRDVLLDQSIHDKANALLAVAARIWNVWEAIEKRGDPHASATSGSPP
jgi:hypothetical protein